MKQAGGLKNRNISANLSFFLALCPLFFCALIIWNRFWGSKFTSLGVLMTHPNSFWGAPVISPPFGVWSRLVVLYLIIFLHKSQLRCYRASAQKRFSTVSTCSKSKCASPKPPQQGAKPVMEVVWDIKFIVTGDPFKEERTLAMMNHRTNFDWLFYWDIMGLYGSPRHLKVSWVFFSVKVLIKC